jgi:uncharacterized protein
MERTEMDAIVNDHFMYEANDDLDGVMGTLAEGVSHEIIPGPYGVLTDPERIREFYTKLYTELAGEGVTPVRRLYGDNFVVDETIWHGRISDKGSFLAGGRSGKADLRLLHVFDLRDGRIIKEQAWWDLGLVQRQLRCNIT